MQLRIIALGSLLCPHGCQGARVLNRSCGLLLLGRRSGIAVTAFAESSGSFRKHVIATIYAIATIYVIAIIIAVVLVIVC